MTPRRLQYAAFVLLAPSVLFAQYRPQAKGDSTERYAKIVTKDTKCTMLYDSTEMTKSDAFVIVTILEREGIWSPRVQDARAVFAITNQNVYSVNLFVSPKALSNPVADSILENVLNELKSVYPERRYEFQLMALDSTFNLLTRVVRIK